MTATAVKLTDLIANHRGARANRTVETSPVEVVRDPEEAGTGDYVPYAAPPAPRPIVQDIESLALKLYDISRRHSADPGSVMREALRSIEACLVAIKKHH